MEDDFVDEDKIEFDPHECSIEKGEWVFNASAKPFYTDESCPYLDQQIQCLRNERPDREYLYWQWQLDGCILPRLSYCIRVSFSNKKLREAHGGALLLQVRCCGSP